MFKVEISKEYIGHQDAVYTLLSVVEDSSFYSAGADRILTHWKFIGNGIPTGVVSVNCPIYSIAVHENLLTIGLSDGGIHFIDLNEKRILKSIAVHTKGIFDLKWLVPGQLILAASGDGSFSIWDTNSYICQILAKVSEASIRTIAIHPNGKLFALGSSDSILRIYETDSLTLITQWPAHTNSIFSLAFDPSGETLYSAGRDAHLKSWSFINNYALKDDVIAHWFAINSVDVHPSGRWLATASMDKSIKIWNAQNLKLVKVIDKDRNNGHKSSVNKVVWLPHQHGLISAGDDRRILEWSIDWEGLEKVS